MGDARFDVLIVGAGHAGAQGAIALRQHGFAGSIGLLGDEPELPYERPPLSKAYMAGEKPFERILIRQAAFWQERDITLLPGRRVVTVDADAHRVGCEDGTAIGYGRLIWATGGAARRLSCDGHDLAGVHTIRNRADVDVLAAELPTTSRVVVVGGGYIGLEAAAVLTKLGKQVVLLEAQGRVLARVAGEALSDFVAAEHRAHGVDIRLDTVVESIDGQVRASGVRLANGQHIACDMVIVGIGIIPAIEPLRVAGAEIGDGVLVDDACRTSLPDIHAVGDGARHPNRFAGGVSVRLESVQNAHDQAMVAARDICGLPATYDAVPWFWSDQYDLKIQTVGLSTGHDSSIVRGDPETRRFSVVYLREGAVIALDCVNNVRDYAQGRALVMASTRADPAVLADPQVPLKSLVAATEGILP